MAITFKTLSQWHDTSPLLFTCLCKHRLKAVREILVGTVTSTLLPISSQKCTFECLNDIIFYRGSRWALWRWNFDVNQLRPRDRVRLFCLRGFQKKTWRKELWCDWDVPIDLQVCSLSKNCGLKLFFLFNKPYLPDVLCLVISYLKCRTGSTTCYIVLDMHMTVEWNDCFSCMCLLLLWPILRLVNWTSGRNQRNWICYGCRRHNGAA
jgi:hypothetical protein